MKVLSVYTIYVPERFSVQFLHKNRHRIYLALILFYSQNLCISTIILHISMYFYKTTKWLTARL